MCANRVNAPFDSETTAYIEREIMPICELPMHELVRRELILGKRRRPSKYALPYETIVNPATTLKEIQSRWESNEFCPHCLCATAHHLECKAGPWSLFMIQSMVQPNAEQNT